MPPNRKPVIGVILLAAILSAPQLWVWVQFVHPDYRGGGPLPHLGGLQYVAYTFGKGERYPATYESAPFWNDNLILGNVYEDPETGKHSELELPLRRENWRQQQMAFVAGDRVGFWRDDEVYEVVDGTLQKFPVTIPIASWLAPQFLVDNQFAIVKKSANSFEIALWENGTWQSTGTVALPRVNTRSPDSEIPALSSFDGALQCRNRGDHLDLFLEIEGQFYYREGLKFELESKGTSQAKESQRSNSEVDGVESGDLAGWSQIRSEKANADRDDFAFCGMAVEGQPAAVIIDGIRSGYPIGRFFRFAQGQWSEFVNQPFPIGSCTFRAESTRDSQRSYLIVATSIGASHIYSIDSSGARETKATASAAKQIYLPQRLVVMCLVTVVAAMWYSLLLGILLGLGTSFMMWRLNDPTYEFGVQTVRLASVTWRGFARLIDLSIIAVSTGMLAWQLTIGFDWLSLFEALNLNFDHPSIGSIKRIAALVIACPVVLLITMIFTQAAWGFTPGKWLCRLRTVRTNLRPCGVASSLAREVVFFVDCCNFLWWVPGILSIALTDRRQRLGDFVADTIVVNSRSIRSQT